MPDFLISVRAVSGGAFVCEVADSALYLVTPDGAVPTPSNAVTPNDWFNQVEAAAQWTSPATKEPRGDVLFIVHGYNNSETDVITRHRLIKSGLLELGFKGVVVSFDWPSDDQALAYLADRHRAKITALRLVTNGISPLADKQTPTCAINVHVLGHSTGAYVIREAFHDADDSALKTSGWTVSQVLFAAGDISASSMSTENSGADSIYHHCVRLTNYSNRHDAVLDISNVKRLGIAPRVGRVGLPADVPAKAVNVDCSAYYAKLVSDQAILKKDEPAGITGAESHSWYFGNAEFTTDLFQTIIGIDRTMITTRTENPDGSLALKS